jgi:hypothetical protein
MRTIVLRVTMLVSLVGVGGRKPRAAGVAKAAGFDRLQA